MRNWRLNVVLFLVLIFGAAIVLTGVVITSGQKLFAEARGWIRSK